MGYEMATNLAHSLISIAFRSIRSFSASFVRVLPHQLTAAIKLKEAGGGARTRAIRNLPHSLPFTWTGCLSLASANSGLSVYSVLSPDSMSYLSASKSLKVLIN